MNQKALVRVQSLLYRIKLVLIGLREQAFDLYSLSDHRFIDFLLSRRTLLLLQVNRLNRVAIDRQNLLQPELVPLVVVAVAFAVGL